MGGGGREHALVWKLGSSRYIDEIHCAPGNPGMAGQAVLHDVAVADTEALVRLALNLKADVVIIGPEAPLAAGLADQLAERGIKSFGPRQSGAQLESSKIFAKRLMAQAGIPTARWKSFDDIDEASEYVQKLRGEVVIKADGLAAGKGVSVCRTVPEAISALVESMQHRKFGDAGTTVLVEELLTGPELSVLALCDGKTVLALPAAQDYKRAYDRNKGPNTGGMGAYSPVPICTPQVAEQVMDTVLQPCVETLIKSGENYVGVIYAGLMMTPETENEAGGLRVIEFNCRFGDPETQAILPRVESDLGELILASVERELPGMKLNVTDRACVSVVAASGGYPEQEPLQTGFAIDGLEVAAKLDDVVVFHAATKAENDRLVTSGGRVLAVSALGDDQAEARSRAYEAIEKISFQGMRFRTDVAKGK